jgi:Fe-S oxidoreductase
VRNKFTSGLLKRTLGFAEDRTIPLIGRVTVRRWARRNLEKLNTLQHAGAERVVLFLDEFTNYNDTEAGIKTIKLLSALGYRIQIPDVTVSGRTFISKGLIRTAKKKATKNVRSLTSYVSDKQPLVGVEPSAILSFRDEYPELVDKEDLETSQKLARNSYMLEEFILREIERGNIKKEMFTREKRRLKFHGHCQQKAIATTRASVECLSFPENYEVEEIPSGCCGMAGSFGYEKEHYDLSQKVGELVLFPAVRESSEEMIIVAAGTSCRHQIVDGTGRRAFHPGEVLFDALDK